MKLLLALLLLPLSPAMRVDLVVVDTSGAPLKDELVIVQDLHDRQHEVLRALTDQDGKIPALNLEPGLYRAIATAPYGVWETEIREFLVTAKPLQVKLRASPMSTHGFGDIVPVRKNGRKKLKVLQDDGNPAAGADLYVRDREATLYMERRYKTNSRGEAEIELVSEPTVVTIVSRDSLTPRMNFPTALLSRYGFRKSYRGRR